MARRVSSATLALPGPSRSRPALSRASAAAGDVYIYDESGATNTTSARFNQTRTHTPFGGPSKVERNC